MAVFDSETHVPSLNVKMQISKLHRTPQHPMRPHLTRPKQFVELLRFIYTSRLAKVFSRFHCCFFRSESFRVFKVFVGPSAFLQVSPQVNSQCCLRGSKKFQQSCQLTWQYLLFNNSTTFCWQKTSLPRFAQEVLVDLFFFVFFQTIVLVEDIFHRQNIVENHLWSFYGLCKF